MADFSVPAVTIAAVEHHPQADRLDLATPEGLGYRVVVGRGEFAPGDRAFYFPLDAVIPEPWVDRFGIRSFYFERVCAARIRGEFSEGLLISPAKVSEIAEPQVGADYAGFFGATKFAHPIPEHMGGEARRVVYPHEAFPEPQALKKYGHLITEGEEVVMEEKIHGSCLTVKNSAGEGVMAGSYSLFLKDSPANDNNIYIQALRQSPALQALPVGFQVYGEVFGAVQRGFAYGLAAGELDVRVFAVRDGRHLLDFDDTTAFCHGQGLLMPPRLYRGPYSLAKVLSFEGADSVVSKAKGQMMEGVVIRPVGERASAEIGRVCLKYVCQRYLLRKGGTEYK